MDNKLEVELSRLEKLGNARSALWALRQLTSAENGRPGIARSYFYELHEIAERGLASMDLVINDMESFVEEARSRRFFDPS